MVNIKYTLPTEDAIFSWEAIERVRADENNPTSQTAQDAHGVHMVCEVQHAGVEYNDSDSTGATESSSLLLVQQFRPAVHSDTLELPAGLIDAGEAADTAGLRELQEETGITATAVRATNELLSVAPGTSNTSITTLFCKASLGDAVNADFYNKQAEGDAGIVKPILLPLFDASGAPVDALTELNTLASQNNVRVRSELYSLVYGFQLSHLLQHSKL